MAYLFSLCRTNDNIVHCYYKTIDGCWTHASDKKSFEISFVQHVIFVEKSFSFFLSKKYIYIV